MRHNASAYTVVLVELNNIALKKPASQTSTDGNEAHLAVDGLLLTQGQCSRTKVEKNPAWRVDLGTDYIISSVSIFTPQCCGEYGM